MATRVGLSSRMPGRPTERMEAAKNQQRLAKPAPSRRHAGNNAASSEDEDEDDESTLRAMSALGQQERAHPGLKAAKPPASTTSSKTPAATTMPAVRQLLQAVELDMRSCVGRGDDSRLVVALESAKYELADAERRRHADWTRVLALASQLQASRSSPSPLVDPAAELAALAQRRLGMAVDRCDAPTLVDSNQDEDGEEDEDAEDAGKSEPAPQQPDEPAGAWAADEPAALVDKELRAAKLPLSLTVAEPVKRSVQEPKPPKAGHAAGASASACKRSARLKFQFPDADVTQWTDVEDGGGDGNGRAGSAPRPAASALPPRRRVSVAAPASASSLGATPSITGAVPLRRRSFSMKRSPRKPLSDAITGFRPPSAVPSAPTLPGAAAMRRKSTSVLDAKLLLAKRRTSLSRVAHLALSPGRPSTSTSAPRWPSAASPGKAKAAAVAAASSCSQLVLRVRERKRDGVRELVLRKQPRGPPVVWHWHDRHRGAQALLDEYERVVSLGPHQHGVMLRQLRFVKAAMHEFPWAKTHLRELLARYTAQQLSKEALYPQLALLSTQVQSEVAARAAHAKSLAARKQRLTLMLTLATGVVNDVRATKFGRRGRPHATRLCYDPSDPLRLRWVRKGGDRSDECLHVDELQVLEQEQALARDGASFDLKRVLKTNSGGGGGESDCACLLSLVSPGRALDLRVKSPLHREWLAMALREVSAFARQFRASGAVASPRRRIASGI